MELVVVNGSNAISRGVIKKLSNNYSKVRLLDFRPYRKSVYKMQRALPSSVELEKKQVQSGLALDYALEGADKVVYFTHDYLAMTSSKNDFLKRTALSAKNVGVSKFVAVCPVELDMHYSEDATDAIEQRNEAEGEAFHNNPDMVLMRSNVVFGSDAHLLHYLQQCAFAGKVPKSLGSASSYSFNPIHHDDLAKAIETAWDKFDEAKGQKWNANGTEGRTIADMLGACERAAGKGTTSQYSNFGISDLVEEWFSGLAHDKNLGRMAQHYESHRPSLKDNDFFEHFNVEHEFTFSSHYSELGRVKEDDFVFPTFSSYKQVSLD